MRRLSSKVWLAVLAVVAVAVASHSYSRSLAFLQGALERPSALWMAALKGFEGPVYYFGSDGAWSYFRAGELVFTRYKAQTSKLGLPRTFPLGQGEPYRVTQDMVYSR